MVISGSKEDVSKDEPVVTFTSVEGVVEGASTRRSEVMAAIDISLSDGAVDNDSMDCDAVVDASVTLELDTECLEEMPNDDNEDNNKESVLMASAVEPESAVDDHVLVESLDVVLDDVLDVVLDVVLVESLVGALEEESTPLTVCSRSQ